MGIIQQADTRTDMARRKGKKRGRPVHGWLVLNKPLDMTSTEAVNIVKRLFDARKVGHGGTLDPLATGVLPIAFGEATKTVQFVMDSPKTYRFTVRWGEERSTDDAEGEVVDTSAARPAREDIEALLPVFTGEIMQVPPTFSAIKVKGERAYDLARDGEAVQLKPRPVMIYDLRLIDMPDADTAVFEARTGKGAYVRALARDLGRELGCLGHVSALERSAVGPFTLKDAITLEKLEELRHKDADRTALDAVLLPLATALDDIPALAVDQQQAARIASGQAVLLRGAEAPVAQDTVLVTWKGRPVALGTVEAGMLKPKRVFNLSGTGR